MKQIVKKFADIDKHQGKKVYVPGLSKVVILDKTDGGRYWITTTWEYIGPTILVKEVTTDCEFCTVPCGRCEKPVEATQEDKEYSDIELACKGCMGPCGRCEEPKPHPRTFTFAQWSEQATRLRKEGYEKGVRDEQTRIKRGLIAISDEHGLIRGSIADVLLELAEGL